MSDQEAANWAIRVMRAGGKSMDVLTAQKLVFTVGHDAALLRQEMDKLMAFAQERTEISEEDIDSICTRSLEATIFQLVDAQVGGKIREACTLLQTLLENGEDRFMVLALLLRQYRILYHDDMHLLGTAIGNGMRWVLRGGAAVSLHRVYSPLVFGVSRTGEQGEADPPTAAPAGR